MSINIREATDIEVYTPYMILFDLGIALLVTYPSKEWRDKQGGIWDTFKVGEKQIHLNYDNKKGFHIVAGGKAVKILSKEDLEPISEYVGVDLAKLL